MFSCFDCRVLVSVGSSCWAGKSDVAADTTRHTQKAPAADWSRCSLRSSPGSLPHSVRSLAGLRCLRRRASRAAAAPFSPAPEWWAERRSRRLSGGRRSPAGRRAVQGGRRARATRAREAGAEAVQFRRRPRLGRVRYAGAGAVLSRSRCRPGGLKGRRPLRGRGVAEPTPIHGGRCGEPWICRSATASGRGLSGRLRCCRAQDRLTCPYLFIKSDRSPSRSRRGRRARQRFSPGISIIALRRKQPIYELTPNAVL